MRSKIKNELYTKTYPPVLIGIVHEIKDLDIYVPLLGEHIFQYMLFLMNQNFLLLILLMY